MVENCFQTVFVQMPISRNGLKSIILNLIHAFFSQDTDKTEKFMRTILNPFESF